ncbi:MAG: hypothetical protein BWY76_02805 [bacterium ADurb.Bin429]|nr:MAG: hypothetical protein BWY76_02805 [bacterium ADurb.Bin429]
MHFYLAGGQFRIDGAFWTRRNDPLHRQHELRANMLGFDMRVGGVFRVKDTLRDA